MFKDEDEAARRKRIAALRGEGSRAATPSPQAATPPALPAQAPLAPSLQSPQPRSGSHTKVGRETGAAAPNPAGSALSSPNPSSPPGASKSLAPRRPTPPEVVAASERGDRMGAEKMGALDVALGLTRNKLDLARDGKGALGKTFRQRFEAEGYRFGPSGRITHGSGEGKGSAPLELTPGRGRQCETLSGREALGAVTRLAGEPRGTAGRLWRAFRSKPRPPFLAARSPAERGPCWASFSAKGAISALAQGKAFCYHSAAFGPEA